MMVLDDREKRFNILISGFPHRQNESKGTYLTELLWSYVSYYTKVFRKGWEPIEPPQK